MARTMKVNDTYPPLRGQASDDAGNPVNLTTAASLQVIAKSPSHTITGAATAIWPPTADPDGVHQWNWQYAFVAGDTANVGVYTVILIVTWAPGEIQTFPDSGSESLTIEADP